MSLLGSAAGANNLGSEAQGRRRQADYRRRRGNTCPGQGYDLWTAGRIIRDGQRSGVGSGRCRIEGLPKRCNFRQL